MHLVFPPISPFLELVQHVQQIPDKIVVRDHYSGRTATAGQLLQSVASLREKLQAQASQLQNGNGTCNGNHANGNGNHANGNGNHASQDKFYYLIAAPGLEYVVSMLTIFSLGGVMSAQCKCNHHLRGSDGVCSFQIQLLLSSRRMCYAFSSSQDLEPCCMHHRSLRKWKPSRLSARSMMAASCQTCLSWRCSFRVLMTRHLIHTERSQCRRASPRRMVHCSSLPAPRESRRVYCIPTRLF